VANFKLSQIVLIVNFLKEKKQTKKGHWFNILLAQTNGLILANNILLNNI
jgi:hypothetical protein